MATLPGTRLHFPWLAAIRKQGGHFLRWSERWSRLLLGVVMAALLLTEFVYLGTSRGTEAVEQRISRHRQVVSAVDQAQMTVLRRAALTEAMGSSTVAPDDLRAAHQAARDAWERLRISASPVLLKELPELESLFSEQTLELKRRAEQPRRTGTEPFTVRLAQRLQAVAHAERQELAEARQLRNSLALQEKGAVRWRNVALFLVLILGTFALLTGWRRERLAQQQLRQRTDELLDAQRLARVGSWYWQIDPDEVSWSPELYSIAHWDPQLPPPNYAQHSQLYTAESWARLASAVQGALEHGTAYELELEMVRPDGEHRRVVGRGEAQRDASGRITRLRGTLQDVHSRWEVEEALRRARDAAELAVRSKSEFLATMSHEIRTPMNGVIGMTSLLMETPLTVEQREYLEIVRSSGDALLSIINDILDYSKIEAGMLELEKVPLDPRQVVEEAIGVVSDLASAKGLRLSYWVSSDVAASYLGDPLRLRQIVLNLLSNAIKFTSAGSVSLLVEALDPGPGPAPRVRFSVIDTGIGLSDEQQGRLFQSFSQADGSTTRKYGGTGLGLSISRRLVVLMGGEIGVESELGRGSTFWFTVELPVLHQPAAASPPQQLLHGELVLLVTADPVLALMGREVMESVGLQVLVSEPSSAAAMKPPAGRKWAAAAIDLVSTGPALVALAEQLRAQCSDTLPLLLIDAPGSHPLEASRFGLANAALLAQPLRKGSLVRALRRLLALGEPADREAATELSGTTILLAEDNVTNQILATAMLERLGCVVEIADNGLKAVQAATERQFSLILMDCQMPEMDGWEAARTIRERVPGHVPIVALTANALTGDRERCLEAGMDDYLTKPISLGALRTQISKWTRAARPVSGASDPTIPGPPPAALSTT